MRRFPWLLVLPLALSCTTASPTPPSATPGAPTATVMLVAPDAALPSRAAEPPPAAPAPDAPAPPQAGEAPPAGPSPTALVGETIARADDVQALAAAPPSESGAAPAPTAVALPPSARQVPRQAPTAAVLASSAPVLAAGGTPSGTAEYARAIKLVQDSRKRPGEPRLEERINAAIAGTRATGAEVEVVGWQAALKGTTNLCQVTLALRVNRQGAVAEWEVDLAAGTARSVNSPAEALEGS